MKKIIVASNNAHKIKEISQILDTYEILRMSEIGFNDDIVEDGNTYEENATIKAKTIRAYVANTPYSDCVIIADDSGLAVDALNGAPGVFSARYSGLGDEGNRQKLLKELDGIENRGAHFYCCMAVSTPDGKIETLVGKTHGTITHEKRGSDTFGYDPLFMSDTLGKTFGEATKEEKNSVSHRYYALKKVKDYLEKINY